MSAPASGARTLLGLKIDRQIPGQQLGCPEPVIAAIAAPSAPATSVGSGLPATLEYAPVGIPSLSDFVAATDGTVTDAHVWDIFIDTAAGTDKFTWTKDGSGGASGVSITGAAQSLGAEGITVTFGHTTGHAAADWTINTIPVGSPAGPAATGGGTYSGSAAATFDIEIDNAIAGPATFKWRKNGGSWTSGVPTTDASPITLSDGMTVTFTTPGTFGFDLGDAWTIAVTGTPADEWTITSAVNLGGVTGASVLYKMATIYAGRGETAASAASATIAPTNEIVTVTPAASPTTGGAVVLGRVFYRKIDSGPYLAIKYLWTNTTTPFNDSVMPGAEGTRTPRSGTTGSSAEQTGANFGFQFIRVDNASDFNRDDTYFKSTEQTGRLGEPRGIPGPVKYSHAFNFDVRIGTLVPLLASMMGKATATQNTAEPVVTYAFPLSDLSSDSISLSALFYKGGDFRPQLNLGMKCSDIELDFGKKQTGGKAKLTGQHDTECGFGKALSGNSGSFASAPVVRGVRSDANAYSDSAYVKVIAAPTVSGGIGSFTIRAALSTPGNATPSFGSAITSKVYYDPSTKRQIHPAAIGNATATSQQSAWIELWESTTGLALGFDEGENRKPFEVYFPGDVTVLAANDTFEVPALLKVPNVYSDAHPTGPGDDGSYSGQRPRFTFTSRMTPAHVTLFRGPNSTGMTVLDAQTGVLKIARPIDAVEGLGPEAANPIDVDVYGKFVIGFDVDRRYITREFERAAKADGRFYAVVQIQSHRVVVDPVSGTLSALREQLIATLPQARVDKTAAVLSGDKVIPEKITITPEQPDDDTLEVLDLSCQTAHSWDFSRV